MNSRFKLLLAAFALLAALDVPAQSSSPKVPRVGYCYGVGDPAHPWTRTFIEGLRKRGWQDGRNVRVVLMPLGSIKNEDFGLTGSCQTYMADQKLDVLVIPGHREEHPKIPVVTELPGVAGSALARSMSRNVTGLTSYEEGWQLDAKRIALLKEAVGAERVMLLAARPSDPVARPNPVPELAPIIAYGVSMLDMIDRHAYFVDRILRGAKPADLPFEQEQPRLAINVDAARVKGITFPQTILTQAHWVVPHQPLPEVATPPEPPAPWIDELRAILRAPQPLPPELEERLRAIFLQSQ